MSNQRENVVLKASELSKSFSVLGTSDLKVLDEVNLTLKQSSSLSIRGDSGCGKTTLLNLLAAWSPRMVELYSGVIERSLRPLKPMPWKRLGEPSTSGWFTSLIT